MINNDDGCILAHNHQPSSSEKKTGSRFEEQKKKDNENGHVNEGEGDHIYKKIFKKGPWTPEEDALLIDYVNKHGERHWNCVQNTGLIRCGKSCRLRWTNHLRPDLKKGAFSPEEERIVLDLHAKLGNKWSKIAAELPGRTDNEVKNFWNTKIKRRMKVNELILNSQGNHPKEVFTFHQHLQQQNIQKTQGQLGLSSTPNSMKNIHSSLTPPLLSTTNPNPMSTSNLKAQYLENPCENAIRSSEFNDPILSFLNNPAYKYHFLSEEEKGSYDFEKCFSLPIMAPNSRLELPQSSCKGNSFDTNKVFFVDPLESIINHNSNYINGSSQCGSYLSRIWDDPIVKIEQPSTLKNCQQIPTFGMVDVECGINDSWLISLMGKNSDIDRSFISKQGNCTFDDTTALYDAGKMETLLVGHKRLMDNHNVLLRNNGIKRLKVEPLEELMPVDDDLSSLLHDFSWMSSPTPLYYASNETSIPNQEETFELPIATTITNESIATTITPSNTSTSEFKCNMDDYCLTNSNKDSN